MRISDWSSDVCSSDLADRDGGEAGLAAALLEDDLALDTAAAADELHAVDQDDRLRRLGRAGQGAGAHPPTPSRASADRSLVFSARYLARRSEASRGGQACVSTIRSRWSPYQ